VNDKGEKNNRLLCKVKKGGLNGAFILLFLHLITYTVTRAIALYSYALYIYLQQKSRSAAVASECGDL